MQTIGTYEEQAYQSPFLNFVGNSPTMKVLAYMISVRESDFCITDIAENADIGRATLYRIWDDLIENDVLLFTRTVGRAKLYKLNTESLKIRKLIELYDMILLEQIERRRKK